VQFVDGKLSVRAQDVPLVSVLDAVRRKTGVSFVGAARLRGSISANFTRMPLPEALGEILRNVNHVLQWTRDPQGSSQVSRVVVLASDAARADADGAGGSIPAPKARETGAIGTRDLARLALDPDASTRRWALRALSGSTNADAAGAFREALRDPDPEVREEALCALAYAGGANLRAVEEILAREEAFAVRIAAIHVLGEVTEEGRTEVLARLLEDRDPAIRVAVVEAAGRQEHPMANDILLRAMQDAESSVRMAALSTAVYYAPGEGARTAVERALHDSDAGVRALAEELMDGLQYLDQAHERG
jgi:HEAT repeat protein